MRENLKTRFEISGNFAEISVFWTGRNRNGVERNFVQDFGEISGNIGKYRENFGKYREISGNIGKYREISRKYRWFWWFNFFREIKMYILHLLWIFDSIIEGLNWNVKLLNAWNVNGIIILVLVVMYQ